VGRRHSVWHHLCECWLCVCNQVALLSARCVSVWEGEWEKCKRGGRERHTKQTQLPPSPGPHSTLSMKRFSLLKVRHHWTTLMTVLTQLPGLPRVNLRSYGPYKQETCCVEQNTSNLRFHLFLNEDKTVHLLSNQCELSFPGYVFFFIPF